MKRIYLKLGVTFTALVLGFTPASAENAESQVAQTAIDATISALKGNGPDWLKRTDLVADVQRKNKPSFSIETIQPLYEDSLNTFFMQGRGAYSDQDGTFNIGLGYRNLLNDKSWMFGVNGFYDATTRRKHQRWGVGLELFSEYATFRGNYYKAITGAKSYVDVNGNTATEWALDGADISLETPVPFLPWMAVTATGYQWKTINLAKNIRGGSIGARAHLFDYLDVEAGWTDDNVKKGETYAQITWHFGKPDYIEHTATSMPYSYHILEKRNLENYRLEKVRRHNDIVVEKKITNGGISIGRRA